MLEARPVPEDDHNIQQSPLLVTGYLVMTTTNENVPRAVPMGEETTASQYDDENNNDDDNHSFSKNPTKRRRYWRLLLIMGAMLIIAGGVVGILMVFVLGNDNGGGPQLDEGETTNDNDNTANDLPSTNPPSSSPGTNEELAPSTAPSPPTNNEAESSFLENPLLNQLTPAIHSYNEWTMFFVEWGFFLDDCQGSQTNDNPPPTLIVSCQAQSGLESLDNRNIHVVGQLENQGDRHVTRCEYLSSTTTDNNHTLQCVVDDFGEPGPPPKQFQTTLLIVCGGSDVVNQAVPLRAEVQNVYGNQCGTRTITNTDTTEFRGEVSTGVAIGMVCRDVEGDTAGLLSIDQSDTVCTANELPVGNVVACVDISSCRSDAQFGCDIESVPILVARNVLDDNIFGPKSCTFTEKLPTGGFNYNAEEWWTLALESGFGNLQFASLVHLTMSVLSGLPDNDFEN